MEYGINIQFCIREGGLERAAKRVAEAGFTMLDYTPDLWRDDWQKQAKEAQKIFDAHGLTVRQTHAPFNRYRSYSPENFLLYLERCAEAMTCSCSWAREPSSVNVTGAVRSASSCSACC